MTLFIAIGALDDEHGFIDFDQPILVRGERDAAKDEPRPPPAIEMYEVGGVWMCLEDAIEERRTMDAARATRILATPFNNRRW